jgi:hypothetical protein
MSKAKLAYAVWPWGLQEKEQMVQAVKDMQSVGFRYFESVCTAVTLFKDSAQRF